MDFLDSISLPGALREFLPFLALIAALSLGLWLVNWALLSRQRSRGAQLPYGRQILMLVLTIAGVLVAVLALPVSAEMRNQLLTLLGLALTVVITLSSTTFVANIMAGLMLRAVRSFRTGDFLRVEDLFGRVTERGLFHTEVQTEDRDLTTIPNLVLISKPFTVVRNSGTIVSAEVSLGYDLHHTRVEGLLLAAAHDAQLKEPFVHIRELGDFSITYRVSGFLSEVKRLLSVRSRLREGMVDKLHGDGIEIVSPTFMNQRRLGREAVLSTSESSYRRWKKDAETIVFDKAERAQEIESCRKEIADLQAQRGETKDEAAQEPINARIEMLERKIDSIQAMIDAEEGD